MRNFTFTPIPTTPYTGPSAWSANMQSFLSGDKQPTEKSGLDTYGRDMTASAGKTDPVIGRDDEIDRVVCTLCRRTKNSAVLVGEPGVGKTAVAEGLAQRIAAGAVRPTLAGARVVELDVGAMVAGTKYRGMFEERIKKVIRRLRTPTARLCSFSTRCTCSSAPARAIAAAWTRPTCCVGATTFTECRKYVEKDAALVRRFHKVHVEEPSIHATIAILQGLKKRYEDHHRLKIQDAAIVAAVQLAAR
jgi:ATP-dependent Clp protease ATP-binding subunit ClpB